MCSEEQVGEEVKGVAMYVGLSSPGIMTTILGST
jgi:hypothetical protein